MERMSQNPYQRVDHQAALNGSQIIKTHIPPLNLGSGERESSLSGLM